MAYVPLFNRFVLINFINNCTGNSNPQVYLVIFQNCHVCNLLPDGNCVFWAVFYELYGSDEHHIQVRSIILEVIQCNYITYYTYWIEDMLWEMVTLK